MPSSSGRWIEFKILILGFLTFSNYAKKAKDMLKQKIEYFVKRPNGTRKTYSIVRRTSYPGKKPVNKTIKHPALTAINERVLKYKQVKEATELQLKDLINQLKKRDGLRIDKAAIHAENLRVFDTFWEERFSYRAYADYRSERSVKDDYRRAIEALGDVSIVTATEKEIRAKLAHLPTNKRRRLISKIVQMAEFVGRKLRLQLPKKQHKPITHLTESELELVIKDMEPMMQKLYRALFWSGLRIGEMEYSKLEHFKGKYLEVPFQITETREVREVKGGKGLIRKAFILDEGIEAVKEWCKLDAETKRKARQARHTAILGRACEKHFPGQPEKRCSPHSLRHSYAINLISRRYSLDQVAQCLGNSPKVCADHYSGHVLTDSGIDAMEAMEQKQKGGK